MRRWWPRAVRRMRPPMGGPEEALVHADALHQLARYLTHRESDAEDLVQETYVRAVEAWGRLAPDSNVKAWLFRILRNVHLSRYRKERLRPVAGSYDTIESDPAPLAGNPPLLGDRELERLRGLVGADIEAALRRLSEDARTVVLLDAEGFTETELAHVLGCAVGTVKSRLSRARAELRLLLADYAIREQP